MSQLPRESHQEPLCDQDGMPTRAGMLAAARKVAPWAEWYGHRAGIKGYIPNPGDTFMFYATYHPDRGQWVVDSAATRTVNTDLAAALLTLLDAAVMVAEASLDAKQRARAQLRLVTQ